MAKHQIPYSHIILTRFNLLSGSAYERHIRSSSGWLEHRFELFEKYCLPSVLNQSNQNFTWFIFFDANTPNHFKNRVKQYQIQCPNMKPLWVKGIPPKFVRAVIKFHIKDTDRLLITTRLDNDDAINVNFIKELQDRVINIKEEIDSPLVLNFDRGLCLNKNRTYSCIDKSNAFASLVEPIRKEINTIWQYKHDNLNRFEMLNLQEPAMWLQIIHRHNVSNRVRGFRIKNKILLKNFKLNHEVPIDKKTLFIILENSFLSPIRIGIQLIRSKMKNVVKNKIQK